MNKLAYELGKQAAEEELTKIAAGATDPSMWTKALDSILSSRVTPYAAGSGLGAGIGAGAGYAGAPDDRGLEGALMGAGIGGLAGAGGVAGLSKGLSGKWAPEFNDLMGHVGAEGINLGKGVSTTKGLDRGRAVLDAIKANPAAYASLLAPGAAAGGAYGAGSQLDPGMLQQIKDALGL